LHDQIGVASNDEVCVVGLAASDLRLDVLCNLHLTLAMHVRGYHVRNRFGQKINTNKQQQQQQQQQQHQHQHQRQS
jgi:hypothetical protein